MNRASPVELRKALETANAMVKSGISFICVPVLNDDDRQALAMLAYTRLTDIAKELEANEKA